MRTELRAEGWRTVGNTAVRGRAFEDGRLLTADAIAERFSDAATEHAPFPSITALAADLEGFFSAVITLETTTYIVSDRARSIPLYYAIDGGIVSDRGRIVKDEIGGVVDPVAESEFLLTRYVTGPETVWEGVSATHPGEVVELNGGDLRRWRYWEYWPASTRDTTGSTEDPMDVLRRGFETALDRLQRVADGRPIVVPLSGGYDSRLLAAALVARDHEVVGFTFGRSGHPDVELSREVADRLRIRWEFVPYSAADWWEWYHSEACERYRTEAFGGDALPFLAEWPAIHRLLEEERVPADALFCPGHTVATPSERLPAFAVESGGQGETGCGLVNETGSRPIEATVEALVAYILERHYNLWEWDDEAFASAARKRIERGLLGDRPPAAVNSPATAAAAYERWEWNGRMTTFTNGDLRVYEDAGVDWWLPLWDPAYVRSWEQIPLAARRNKRLHAELAADYYRQAGDIPPERADLTDRSLTPFDRHLALVRHAPARQFTERDGKWDPPFLAPRSAWDMPGQHPLGWDGVVVPELLEAVWEPRSLYALRTLAATGRLDLTDPAESIPSKTIHLPTSEE